LRGDCATACMKVGASKRPSCFAEQYLRQVSRRDGSLVSRCTVQRRATNEALAANPSRDANTSTPSSSPIPSTPQTSLTPSTPKHRRHRDPQAGQGGAPRPPRSQKRLPPAVCTRQPPNQPPTHTASFPAAAAAGAIAVRRMENGGWRISPKAVATVGRQQAQTAESWTLPDGRTSSALRCNRRSMGGDIRTSSAPAAEQPKG
jgi:hypothetical protein